MKLDCKIFRRCYTPISDYEIDALKHGIEACGDQCSYSRKDYEPCDVAIHTSGPKGDETDPLSVARQYVMDRHPRRRLVLESAVFREGWNPRDRDRYFRVSWNGFLRDEAEYANKDSPPDRWHRIRREQGIEVRPWQDRAGPVLVCFQKEFDASLRGMDTYAWGAAVVRELTDMDPEQEIILRPHPLSRGRRRLRDLLRERITQSTEGDIRADFNKSGSVVTYTSLSAVEAVCYGLRTVTTDAGNMAWPVAEHSVKALSWDMKPFSRQQWLYDLAYTQWTVPEIRKGIPWRRLRRIYWPE